MDGTTVLSVAAGKDEDLFGSLLPDPHPPLEMLKLAKEFGKAGIVHGRTIWPNRVCAVLYYGTYAAGLVCWRDRIGNLSKSDLVKGFRQLALLPWISNGLRELFDKAMAQLLATSQ